MLTEEVGPFSEQVGAHEQHNHLEGQQNEREGVACQEGHPAANVQWVSLGRNGGVGRQDVVMLGKGTRT